MSLFSLNSTERDANKTEKSLEGMLVVAVCWGSSFYLILSLFSISILTELLSSTS